MATLKYWLWLTNLRGLSPSAAWTLLEHFGTPESAYFADPAEYALVEGLSPAARNALIDKSMDRAEEILARCDAQGVQILTLQDAQYPERLRQLPDPPAVLYIKGKLFSFDEEPAIAVVGSRQATPYGLSVAGRLGLELARQGALLVSGIAQGVDAAALRGALRGGGNVVSVLGNGVDEYYPKENEALYADVAAAGALISEYPPGTKANGRHFPVRNRIISGLSLGVAVVEGAETSGALITARLALDQNRDTFAVPGSVDAPLSRGPNLLIRRGEAKLIQCAWDILEEYQSRYPGRLRRDARPLDEVGQPAARAEEPPRQPLDGEKTVDKGETRTYLNWKDCASDFTDDERDILLTLGEGTMTADDLVEATQIPARRVLSALTMLQVRGMLEEQPGRRFRAIVILRTD